MAGITPKKGFYTWEATDEKLATFQGLNGNFEILDNALLDTAPTWTNATLQNGWVNYGGTEPNAGYSKIGSVVRLRGIIKDGTATSNTTILTLPSGFRPSIKAYAATLCSGNEAIRVLINTDGTVNIQGTINNAWVQLENISFVADGN